MEEQIKCKTALILAAGISTPEYHFPKDYKPKCLCSVNGEVILERNVKMFKKYGVDNIIVVVGYKKEQIIEFDKDRNLGLKFVENSIDHRGQYGALESFCLGLNEFQEDSFIWCEGDVTCSEEYFYLLLNHKNDLVVNSSGQEIFICKLNKKKLPNDLKKFFNSDDFKKYEAKDEIHLLEVGFYYYLVDIGASVLCLEDGNIVELDCFDFATESNFNHIFEKIKPITTNKIDNNALFWKIRAKDYDSLSYVTNTQYLDDFISMCDFNKDDVVLDVGTGTGAIAKKASNHVHKVIAIDASKEMLNRTTPAENIEYLNIDILNSSFKDNSFDKVVSRLVFHHIEKEKLNIAISECHRILKENGTFILSEGVPPTKRVLNDYIEIFKYKENRTVFYEEDLLKLFEFCGFKNIESKISIIEKFSVNNWITNCGLDAATQKKIYDLHKNSSDYFKEDYNLIEENEDCFIDLKMVTIKGTK